MTPTLELKFHQWVSACACFLIVGLALSSSIAYTGWAFLSSSIYESDSEVVVARYNMETARHKQEEARYNAMTVMDKIVLQGQQASAHYRKCGKRKKC